MDDLLADFLTETQEGLVALDAAMVRLERAPGDRGTMAEVFRVVHTIKGTCGFLGLPRLEALAHAAETLMGKFRDGMPVTSDAVTLILATLDRVKELLGELERTAAEPEGNDGDLIGKLEQCVAYGPGILELAHQPDEYVVVDDLVASAKVMATAALSLLGAARS